MVCPEGACRYIEGNFRAKKRTEWVQKLLDEIGLDGKRLTIYNVSPGDEAGAAQIIQKTVIDLADLGPNPAV
jgi:coenzyme F420-reducing hydrogenase delta subunit